VDVVSSEEGGVPVHEATGGDGDRETEERDGAGVFAV